MLGLAWCTPPVVAATVTTRSTTTTGSARSARTPGITGRARAGKGLQPRSLELFDDLGIGDRVLANGRMAMPIRSIAPDGRVRLGGDVPESLRDRPDIPYPASLITPNGGPRKR